MAFDVMVDKVSANYDEENAILVEMRQKKSGNNISPHLMPSKLPAQLFPTVKNFDKCRIFN